MAGNAGALSETILNLATHVGRQIQAQTMEVGPKPQYHNDTTILEYYWSTGLVYWYCVYHTHPPQDSERVCEL